MDGNLRWTNLNLERHNASPRFGQSINIYDGAAVSATLNEAGIFQGRRSLIRSIRRPCQGH
jgi:hypothetical protein